MLSTETIAAMFSGALDYGVNVAILAELRYCDVEAGNGEAGNDDPNLAMLFLLAVRRCSPM
jgi:hypothetical protein